MTTAFSFLGKCASYIDSHMVRLRHKQGIARLVLTDFGFGFSDEASGSEINVRDLARQKFLDHIFIMHTIDAVMQAIELLNLKIVFFEINILKLKIKRTRE